MKHQGTAEILDFRFWILDYVNRKSKIHNPKCTHNASLSRGQVSIFAVFLSLVAVSALGIVGYVAWNLAIRQDQTAKKLWETEAALQSSRGTFQVLHDEYQKLSDEYDTLKNRWAKTSGELQQLAGSSAQMSATLSELSHTRAELQQTLEASQRSTEQLNTQLAHLQRETSTQERAFHAREAQLREAANRSLTLAELEQVAQHLLEQQRRARMLSERVAELSNAYEQLAQANAQAQDGAGSPRARMTKPAVRARGLSEQHLAALYRKLGESYLAIHAYQQAAEALEQSLALHDDPAVHEQLAVIYGRFLHDHEKAALHQTSKMPADEDVGSALRGSAKAAGLPRKHRNLVWDWLIR